MTEKTTTNDELQKFRKEIKNSIKKRSYREVITLSTEQIERLLRNRVLKGAAKDGKLGLGKLIGLSREGKCLSKPLLKRLHDANSIRNKIHGSEEPNAIKITSIKKKHAEVVYFTVEALIHEISNGVSSGLVCSSCYNDWSYRESLCKKCYSEKRDIEIVIQAIREKTNKKLEEIRGLIKILFPSMNETTVERKKGMSRITLEYEGRIIKNVKYGKRVLGKPSRESQNKELDKLYGKCKQRVIKGLKSNDVDFKDAEGNLWYTLMVLLGEEVEFDFVEKPFQKNQFFEKPKEEFKEMESLLKKGIRKKLNDSLDQMRQGKWEAMIQNKSLDILIMLEVFFLVSSLHRQWLAMATAKRCEMERRGFLELGESISGISNEDFFEFWERMKTIWRKEYSGF